MFFFNRINRLISLFFIGLIIIYRKTISPLIGSNCRFNPSCSEYSINAFNAFVVPKAVFLTLFRILKCQPFNDGGIDRLKE